MLRCRCQACGTTFLDGGTASRCPNCGKKGRLEPVAIRGGPPLEQQLAMMNGALAGATQGMVSASIRQRPLARAGAITLFVASGFGILAGIGYLVWVAILGDFIRVFPAVFHIGGAMQGLGGILGVVAGIFLMQQRALGRPLGLAAAGAMLATLFLLFLPEGWTVLFLGMWVSWLFMPLMWLGALGSLILLGIPDRPIASDKVQVVAVGAMEPGGTSTGPRSDARAALAPQVVARAS